jgi:hypothetical protein
MNDWEAKYELFASNNLTKQKIIRSFPQESEYAFRRSQAVSKGAMHS